MSQFRTDTQLTLISRAPVMLLSLISMVFLARLLGPEGNGVYTFIMAGLNLFIVLLGFQLEGSVPVFLAKEKSNSPQLFSVFALLNLLSILIFSLLLSIIVFLIPGGPKWIIPDEHSVRFFFIFLFTCFIFRRSASIIQAGLRGMFQFKVFNLYMILQQLIPATVYGIILLLTLVNSRSFSMLTCFKIILLVETVLFSIGMYFLWQNDSVSFSKNYKSFIKPVYSFSVKNQLSAIGHFINKRIDVWFVQFYQGTAVLGQYGLATQIVNFIHEAMTPFNQVMIPYLAESSLEQHKVIVERIARLNISIAIIAALAIFGSSWLFVPILFGKAFIQAVPAIQILAVGIVFISQRLVFSGYFKAINELHFPLRAAWAGVFVTITLDLILIPKYGIVGASWATILAYGLSTTYLVLKAKKRLGFSLLHILMIRKSDIQWLLSRNK